MLWIEFTAEMFAGPVVESDMIIDKLCVWLGTISVVSRNSVSYQTEIEAMGLLEKKQRSNLLLRVSCGGMGKQSAGKGFKKQVG